MMMMFSSFSKDPSFATKVMSFRGRDIQGRWVAGKVMNGKWMVNDSRWNYKCNSSKVDY